MKNNPNQNNRQDEDKEKQKKLIYLFEFLKNPKNLPIIASLLGGAAVVATSAILLAPASSLSSEPSSVASSAIPSSTIASSVSSETVSSSVDVSSWNCPVKRLDHGRSRLMLKVEKMWMRNP